MERDVDGRGGDDVGQLCGVVGSPKTCSGHSQLAPAPS